LTGKIIAIMAEEQGIGCRQRKFCAGPAAAREVETNVAIEDVDLYSEAKYRGVLPLKLVRQLADLTQRVLELEGRDSTYLDENNRFLKARIARLAGLALAEVNGRIDCYLIELHDAAAFTLKARRRLFAFEADGRFSPAPAPDFWYDVAAIELTERLESCERRRDFRV
jgi:hypothetical protein